MPTGAQIVYQSHDAVDATMAVVAAVALVLAAVCVVAYLIAKRSTGRFARYRSTIAWWAAFLGAASVVAFVMAEAEISRPDEPDWSETVAAIEDHYGIELHDRLVLRDKSEVTVTTRDGSRLLEARVMVTDDNVVRLYVPAADGTYAELEAAR